MLALPVKDIVGVGTASEVCQVNVGFFKHLPAGACLDGFVQLQVTAWKRPCAVAMGVFAFSQKHFAVFHHDNGHADQGPMVRVQIWIQIPLTAVICTLYFVIYHRYLVSLNGWPRRRVGA